MHFGYNSLIKDAAKIPVSDPVQSVSISPIIIPGKHRPIDIQMRVSFPVVGDKLPIIVLSHGMGRCNYIPSLDCYAPLWDFLSGHGFVVINPTHMSGPLVGMKATEGNELWWITRAHDLSAIVDHLDDIEAEVPALKGRLDKSKVAVMGHSLGGWTGGMVLGAENTDPRNGSHIRLHDDRFKAGVLLGPTGDGTPDNMSANGKKMAPFYGGSFSKMATNALVVYGDEDVSPHLTTRGADWHADAYHDAPGPKSLLALKGGRHGMGGVSSWEAVETDDENPERLAAVQRMSWAYLRSALFEGDDSWDKAVEALKFLPHIGSTESK